MRHGFWITVIMSFVIAPSSLAEVLFSEGFDYDPNLNGQSLHGNTNWDGTRYRSGPHLQWTYSTEGLEGGGATISGVGNSKQKVGWDLLANSTTTEHTEYWVRGSFQSADSNLRMRTEFLFNDKASLPTTGDDTSARFGFYGRNLSVATEGLKSNGRSGKQTVRGERFSTGQVYEFLGKITADRTPGALDTFEVWVNPENFDLNDETSLLRPDPSFGGTHDNTIFDGYYLLSGRDFVQEGFVLNEVRLSASGVGNLSPGMIDTISVGTSLADVMEGNQNPEPGTLVVLLLGGTGLLVQHRRRRRRV